MPGEADGRTAHRAVNLARLLQGYDATSTPPAVGTYESGDQVVLQVASGGPAPVYPLQVGVEAVWTRDTDPGTGDHVLMVWGRPRKTETYRKWLPAGNRWCGWKTIVRDEPVRIDQVLLEGRVVLPGGVISLILGVAQAGLSPFFRTRVDLRNGA